MSKTPAKTRTKTSPKRYSFDDHPEHKKELAPWRDKWIANALSTIPMSDDDRAAMRVAVAGLYAAAKLPQPKQIVFVPGPVTAGVAAGIAAGVWYLRDHPETWEGLGLGAYSEDVLMAAIAPAARAVFGGVPPRLARLEVATDDATYAATRAATLDATRAATRAATDVATRAATDAATIDTTYVATRDATDATTYAATRAATLDATRAATRAATDAATDTATDAATRAATYAATEVQSRIVNFLLACARNWANLRSGGNQWSGWAAYIAFFRHVAQLPIDYSHWDHYEKATIHAGPRFVHAKFCIISDRPEFIHQDAEHRPHSLSGPFCRWRDGVELFYVRGVSVPREWVERPNDIDPTLALTHPNVEQRRALCEILGWKKVLEQLSAKSIDVDSDPEIGELLEVDMPGAGESRFLRVRCGTGRDFVLPVPREMKTALQANAWTYGLEAIDYKPEVRT